MNFAVMIPFIVVSGLAGTGVGYLLGVLTEKGHPNENRRRVLALIFCGLFILLWPMFLS